MKKFYLHSIFCGCVSWNSGIFWFRIFGKGLQLRAPWSMYLFSERYGLRKMWPPGQHNWRIGFLND